MSMVKMLVSIPAPLKAKLTALCSRGYTASGFIRQLLEDDFRAREESRKGREELPEFKNLTPWKKDRKKRVAANRVILKGR